jgi:DNA primase
VISQDTIERVKNEANLVEVVAETVKLRRAGMYYSGLCPFHNERSPSFFVRESSNSYICYGCGVSGNVISYVMANRAMSFPDAVEYLAGRFGIEVKRDSLKQAGPSVDKEKIFNLLRTAHIFFRRMLTQVKGGTGEFRTVGEYLKKRGLTAAAINDFGIGYSPNERGALVSVLKKAGFEEEDMLLSGLVRRSAGGDLYELFRGRLLFPIFVDSTRIAGFGGRLVPGVMEASYESQSPKYVNSPETPVYHKSRMLYGLPQAMQAIRESGEVYVVEGYMDVVGLSMRGVKNVVACCGTAMTEQHIKRFSGLCNRIHLLFDGDNAGRAAAAKAFLPSRNAPLDVSACFLPDGIDPDDFARQHGERVSEALKALPKEEPLDVYVDSLLSKAGCSPTEKPGPNLLGRLCDEVSKALSAIEREVVRSTLIARAARRLGVEVTQLEKLVAAGKGKEGAAAGAVNLGAKGVVSAEKRDESSAQPSELGGAVPFPAEDMNLLISIMVLKGELLSEFFSNTEVCMGAHPATQRFASGLSEILVRYPDDEARQREAVKALLQSHGPKWISTWKEAYKRVKADVNMRELYRSSVDVMRRKRLQRELESVTKALGEENLAAENARELVEQQRALKAQLARQG